MHAVIPRRLKAAVERPRRMTRFALAAGACLAGALVVAACSSRVSGSPAQANNQNAQPAAVLANAVNQSAQADTVHLKLDMSITGGVIGSQDVTGTGAVDFQSRQAALNLQLLGTTVDVVAAQNALYLQTDVLGSGWYRIDSSTMGAGPESQLFASGFIDPAKQFDLLKQASTNVQDLGTAQVNGATTTHYRATIDLAKAAADNGVPQSDLNQLKQMGISTVPVDVWVDSQGRIARMALDYTLQPSSGSPVTSGTEVKVTIDYTGYGEPVSITIPPPSQVHDFGPGGFGGLFNGGSSTS